MASVIVANGIWSDTFGLLFTFGILMPALATGLIIVAMISAKGDKEADEQLRGRWGRRRGDQRS